MERKLSACILKIQRFSINDGPGIRTTVFFKGCPLRCLWCHNPDSIRPERQLMLTHKLCTGCGRCVEACPRGVHAITDGEHRADWDRCRMCGRCVEACPVSALSIQGEEMTLGAVMETVERDREYYLESGGGITASGGEPTRQPEFLAELFRRARSLGIGTALDTSGYCRPELFSALADLSDHLLYDLKAMDTALHKTCTGVDNAVILSNFAAAVRKGCAVTVRHIVVPGVNDSPRENLSLAAFLEKCGFAGRLELLPYHRMAMGKYRDLGLGYSLPEVRTPETGEMEEHRAFFAGRGIDCKIN